MRPVVAGVVAAGVAAAGYLLLRPAGDISPHYRRRPDDGFRAGDTSRAGVVFGTTTNWQLPPPPTAAALDAALTDDPLAETTLPPPRLPPRRPDDGFRAGDTRRARSIIGSTKLWKTPPSPTQAAVDDAMENAMNDLNSEPVIIKVDGDDNYTRKYDDKIKQAAIKSHLSPAVLKSVFMAESSLNPDAVGAPTKYGRARGIAQFIPPTWAEMIRRGWAGSGDIHNPDDAIGAGAKYLRWLMDRPGVDGDYRSAILAYHDGLGKFRRDKKTGNHSAAGLKYVNKILGRVKQD